MKLSAKSAALLLSSALVTTMLVPVSFAQSPTPSPGQVTLPYAERGFQGNVGTTFKDSDPAAFPKPVKAPDGAPNVLLVLLDDVGFGQFAVAGGGVPSPNMQKLADDGVFYNRFHTTALCSPPGPRC